MSPRRNQPQLDCCEADQPETVRTLKTTDRNRTCPVLERARKTAQLSQDLTREMKRLRRDLRRCQRCPLNQSGAGCPGLEMFTAAIQTAIQEVNEEWGMS